MGKNSAIQWTTHTMNPWRGCTKVSAGCRSCYAETLSKRNPKTLGVWGDQGTRVVASEAVWREPLKWDRAAAVAGERHRVFCASLSDVFEDWQGFMVNSQGLTLHVNASGEWKPGPLRDGRECGFIPVTMDHVRSRLRWLIFNTPHLDWLLLTKRPENAARWFADTLVPDNIWLGTSVEDQAAADERIPVLLSTPAAVRFLSMEPLLGPVNIEKWLDAGYESGGPQGWIPEPSVDWVIVGGESGGKARPYELGWARSLRDQCAAAGVPYFLKQLGANAWTGPRPTSLNPHVTLSSGLVLSDSHGGDESEWPEDLRGCRAFPGQAVPA